jgi:hypothetical protein
MSLKKNLKTMQEQLLSASQFFFHTSYVKTKSVRKYIMNITEYVFQLSSWTGWSTIRDFQNYQKLFFAFFWTSPL